LMRQRREKLARWRAAGVEPYAYRYDVTHHAGELLARGEAVTADPGERVRVAGRIMSLRGHGKAGFGHLLDRSGSIQLYFRAGHLEVDARVLQPLYGGAFARPFVTRHQALDMDLYLRISNELYLKRLIVGGLERVYEFSRDFRNEGMDRTHNPEFTMLEYYQAFADVGDMMTLTEALVGEAVERACGTRRLEWQGTPLDFTAPWPRVSMLDAVSEKLG